MFPILNIFVVCFIIPSSTYTSPINGDRTRETLCSGQLVEKELAPIEENLKIILDSKTSNDIKFDLKGEVRGSVKKIIERAVGAERKVEHAERKVKQLLKRQERLKIEKNATEIELKRIKAPLSVRERIEFWENMLSPAYQQTKQFTGFHEKRWLFILNNRTDDPMVKRLLAFIESREADGMTIEVFARRISGFFHFSSNKIHVPPLEAYTTGELKQELEFFFGESYDDLTFDVVCALRKE